LYVLYSAKFLGVDNCISRIYYDVLLGCFKVSYAPAHIWQQTRTNRITYLGLKSQNRAANATN
jgi:hypothetical protein